MNNFLTHCHGSLKQKTPLRQSYLEFHCIPIRFTMILFQKQSKFITSLTNWWPRIMSFNLLASFHFLIVSGPNVTPAPLGDMPHPISLLSVNNIFIEGWLYLIHQLDLTREDQSLALRGVPPWICQESWCYRDSQEMVKFLHGRRNTPYWSRQQVAKRQTFHGKLPTRLRYRREWCIDHGSQKI